MEKEMKDKKGQREFFIRRIRRPTKSEHLWAKNRREARKKYKKLHPRVKNIVIDEWVD